MHTYISRAVQFAKIKLAKMSAIQLYYAVNSLHAVGHARGPNLELLSCVTRAVGHFRGRRSEIFYMNLFVVAVYVTAVSQFLQL